uniref:Sad1 n=1 Tax=Arundo donax TaxID=35708 RepID=A0A0A9F451_ARUDO
MYKYLKHSCHINNFSSSCCYFHYVSPCCLYLSHQISKLLSRWSVLKVMGRNNELAILRFLPRDKFHKFIGNLELDINILSPQLHCQ